VGKKPLPAPQNDREQRSIDRNIYARSAVDQTNGSSLDPLPFMMSFSPKEWPLDGFPPPINTQLSELDKEFARINYPGVNPPPPAGVLVPNVVGFTGEGASVILRGIGLVPSIADGAKSYLKVAAQSPQGGMSVPSGSSVLLTLEDMPPDEDDLFFTINGVKYKVVKV